MKKNFGSLAFGLGLLAAVSVPPAWGDQTCLEVGTEQLTETGDRGQNHKVTDGSVEDQTSVGLESAVGEAELKWKRVRQLAPQYPSSSMENKEEGQVVIRLVLLPSGQIDSVAIAESSGYSALDQAALEAAEGIVLTPGDGQAPTEPVTLRIPYRFKLRQE